MSKFEVSYLLCEKCGSLQTEKPYWLEEAYDSNANMFDTGCAQRTLWNLGIVTSLSRLLGFSRILDFGGGSGLLARLMRDYGLDAYSEDKYQAATFLEGIERDREWSPEILTAFEVLEHFDSPETQISSLFFWESNHVLVSTCLYSDEGQNWRYLSKENGQHVFFYSKTAMRLIAEWNSYTVTFLGDYVLFSKSISKIDRLIVRVLLLKPMIHLQRALTLLRRPKGSEDDHNLLATNSSLQPPNTSKGNRSNV